MKRLAVLTGLFFSFLTFPALAANTFIMLFYDDAPLQGVAVEVDGDELGRTDARGSAEATLPAGDHVITLVDDDIEFPVSFSTGAGEEVELSVTFSEGAEPEVTINTFGPGDTGNGSDYKSGS